MIKRTHEAGVALVAALGVIVVVGIVAAFVCKIAVVSNQVTSSQGRSLVSYNLAMSALNAGYQSLMSRAEESAQTDRALLFPNGYENDPNAFADYPDCSGNVKHCYWWLYDGDKPQNFNGWKKGPGWNVHVFNAAKTVSPVVEGVGSDTLCTGDETDNDTNSKASIYRIEWAALDCRGDGQPGWQWYRITSRGLDQSGSRTYLQEYVKVPVTCDSTFNNLDDSPTGDIESGGTGTGTDSKRF